MRGDLVSEDATMTAIVISFDEDRIDDVRAGVIQKIHDIVDPELPAGVRAFYNGSLEISETYNRITLDNQHKFTPPILLITVIAIYLTFRSRRKTFLTIIRRRDQRVLDARALLADGVQLQRPRQHADAAHRSCWRSPTTCTSCSTGTRSGAPATPSTRSRRRLPHLAAPLFGASATTALGMLSLATSDVVAVQSFGVGSAVGIMVDFVDVAGADADDALAR